MNRKQKTWIIVCISIFIIIGGFGGFLLWKTYPAHWNTDRVQIIFPIPDIPTIQNIQGFGETPSNSFHNGIDFGTNQSVEVIACCDMRIIEIKTWYNDGGGHWQTNVIGKYNWNYRFECAFESWALNETYGNLQRDAINVSVGQTVKQGEILGTLMHYGEGTHIHFGMRERGTDVCSYQFMTPYAQSIVDQIWLLYGPSGDDICNG
jgi:murein DD-endopeptidase MepM/ murein hydrolase activator NlpD